MKVCCVAVVVMIILCFMFSVLQCVCLFSFVCVFSQLLLSRNCSNSTVPGIIHVWSVFCISKS